MKATDREPQAEQITATVLFADLVGFDRLSAASGTEKAYLAVTHLLRLLDGIARQHGGSVDKYLGDKLMALFGHPVPLQYPGRAAALAALEMRRRVADYNREADLEVPLGLHVGINTGPLVSGGVRGPVVREFHVLGDAVNVAARINARAPTGEIWVGSAVHAAIRDTLDARALEPLLLKGKSHPVEVFALDASRSSGVSDRLSSDETFLSELVGRGEELARLEAHLRALSEGMGGAVHIVGEAGSGKSRLLAALGESTHLEAVKVLRLHASAIDSERPLSTFAPLLENGSESHVDSEAGRNRAVRRLEARLREMADLQPVLIAVEDVQQIDPDSAFVLDQLRSLSTEAPLLFLTTERSGTAQKARPEDGSAEATIDTIQLGPLSEQEALALALAVLGDGTDDETVDLVLKRGRALPGSILRAAFLAPVLRSESEQETTRGERSSEAERRRAAVVFADLTGFTAMTEQLGAERAYPVVASCLEILDDVARQYRGTVDHHLGDCVMALFGVPRAIEDAPRAALNAAIEMRTRIRSFSEKHDLPVPVDVHTGVATGLGIAGDISGPMIREFAVMGDHVDRADALTHIAEAGEIRVDAATQRATREVFQFGGAERFVMPGDTEPQPTFELLSQAPRLHRSEIGTGRQVFSELVGRDEQLGAIRGAVTALDSGRGGVISLTAEAGIGKSRLLAEISASPEVEGTTWMIGRALSNGRNLGYHPIADLLRSWTRINDGDDEATARHRFDEAMASVLPESQGDTVPLLANMVGLELAPEEREHIDSIQGESAEKIIRGAFVRLLRAVAALGFVTIVMEDLHWADVSSIELIESILGLSAEHPILFINAFRPGFEETSGRVLEVSRQQHADRHTELSLDPLDASAARTMVKNLFRGGDVPQRTRAAIEERAHGNPFYIEEVVRTLVDVGAVEMHDGAFRATEKLDSVQIPDTVQEAVMARVDRLDLARRAVLQAASVIGGTFHLDVLREVVDATGLEKLLAELEESEFISPSDRSAGIGYAFKHPLIQEVIYDSLLQSRRQELHLAVAHATESQLNETLPGYCAMLAFHFSKGRDLPRAEEFLFRAGDEASRAAASNEALYFFQEASALYDELHSGAGETRKRARLEKSLAVAFMNRGRLIEAVDHFDGAARLLGHDSPRGAVSMSFRFARNLTRVLARLYLGRLYGRRQATERDRELIDIMFRRAMAQSTTSPTHFFVDSTEIIRTASNFDPLSVPEAAAIYSGVIAIFSFGGISFGISRRFLDVADDLAESGAVDERFLYYRTLGFLHHLLAGDWSDEHAIDSEAIAEGIREGRFWEASTYLDLDCHRQLYQGNFDTAWERIGQLAEMVDLYENELASSAKLAHTAFVQVEQRDLDAALETIDVYYDEHSEVLFNIVALGTRGRVNVLRGDFEAAANEIGRAEALMREAGRVPPLHASYVHSARYLLGLLDLERRAAEGEQATRGALRRLRRSRSRALKTSEKVPWRRTEALRLAGREAWLRGKQTQAITWWERAIDCAIALGARPELGRTLADAGRALVLSDSPVSLRGKNGTACLQEAHQIFVEVGLSPEREALLQVS
jgi:class 3 adenylate cyclase/predicted ATPase